MYFGGATLTMYRNRNHVDRDLSYATDWEKHNFSGFRVEGNRDTTRLTIALS